MGEGDKHGSFVFFWGGEEENEFCVLKNQGQRVRGVHPSHQFCILEEEEEEEGRDTSDNDQTTQGTRQFCE